jgi:type IV pilus assembly protein PilB
MFEIPEENILNRSDSLSDDEIDSLPQDQKDSQLDNQDQTVSPVQDLSSILLSKGVVSQDQLQVAKKQMSLTGKVSLGEVLVSMGFLTESTLGEAISNTSGGNKFDLKSVVLDPELIRRMPKDVVLRYKAIPVSIDERKVVIATHDVYDVIALDKVQKYFPNNLAIEPIYSSETDILEIIDQYYDYEMSVDGILREIESSQSSNQDNFSKDVENYKNPIVRLVDSILIDAVHNTASDIHFEPEESFLRLRYRVDGEMRQIRAFHKDYWPPIAVRIKIMSDMNIAESRKPQDGHASSNILGRSIDFRVATQPSIYGENIVMRILDKTKSLVSLDQLGFSDYNQKLLQKLLKKPEGIIVVTGPTGSGKTTSLYSILNYINSVDKNIMTLEDPVEYNIPLIRQSEVKKGGISFLDGIKSILRQDPDIIFIGEVRDAETANISIRAAMTGHQVFTTLHTNDAIGVIPRLIDIGIRPYLLSGALVCCVAQRLVRKLCDHCKKSKIPNEDECRILGLEKGSDKVIYEHSGCEKCNNIGYKGRLAMSEILNISKKLDEMIALNATSKAILDAALEEGFVSMAQDGIGKVLDGVTDIEDLIKNVDMTDRL